MSVEHCAYRTADVLTEPWFHRSPSIAEGSVYVLGSFGDHDPKNMLDGGTIDSGVGLTPGDLEVAIAYELR